jgi:hypothetical protein
MTEAWFLFEEAAIRMAAGNPNGTNQLQLPSIRRVEALPDPKSVLRAALLDASGLPSRRLGKFRVPQAFQRLAELIEDYRTLRALAVCSDLETAIADVVATVRVSEF